MQLTSVATVGRFLVAENGRDWERWASFVHPEVRYHVVGSVAEVRGKENYVRRMQGIHGELPDWQFEVVHILGDERTVMVELDGGGHFSGVQGGQRYEGVPLRLRAVCILEVEGDLIREVREYFDAVGY